jgi:hypothetical protein
MARPLDMLGSTDAAIPADLRPVLPTARAGVS